MKKLLYPLALAMLFVTSTTFAYYSQSYEKQVDPGQKCAPRISRCDPAKNRCGDHHCCKSTEKEVRNRIGAATDSHCLANRAKDVVGRENTEEISEGPGNGNIFMLLGTQYFAKKKSAGN